MYYNMWMKKDYKILMHIISTAFKLKNGPSQGNFPLASC